MTAASPGVEEFAGAATQVIGRPPSGWIVDALHSGRALVMLDGVDEVARFDRPRYAEVIGNLVADCPRLLSLPIHQGPCRRDRSRQNVAGLPGP